MTKPLETYEYNINDQFHFLLGHQSDIFLDRDQLHSPIPNMLSDSESTIGNNN
jgi:hypothetical protein